MFPLFHFGNDIAQANDTSPRYLRIGSKQCTFSHVIYILGGFPYGLQAHTGSVEYIHTFRRTKKLVVIRYVACPVYSQLRSHLDEAEHICYIFFIYRLHLVLFYGGIMSA